MKVLDEDQIDSMWSKRKQYLINLPELSAVLNCKHEHIVAAQTGKTVPDDVYNALNDWLNP